MGKIYDKMAIVYFLIKAICFITLGGYALKIAETYSFAKSNTTAEQVASAVLIIVSMLIIADSLSDIIISFIRWIRGEFHENNKITYRSTSLWKRWQEKYKHALCAYLT